MAVIKVMPQKVVQLALAIVERNVVSPWLSTRWPDGTFTGTLGDTVNINIGQLRAKARDYEFRTRTGPIVMDDIVGGGKIQAKLDKHVVSATGITLEQLTLDEIKLMEEVVGPQALAVADDLEAKTLAKFQTIPWKREFAITADHDPLRVVAEARRQLDADKVAPRAGRVFLIGSDVEAAWIVSDRLSRYDSTGQTGTPALRDAIIGRLAGTPVVALPDLPSDFVWYGHPSALMVANVAPVVPTGAHTGKQGVSKNGFAGTWIADYDSSYARDRSMFHSFAGFTDIRDERDAKGDLLDPTGDAYATAKNVRGVGITATGFDGGVLTAPAPAP
jgi:hypothetical protein